jgi:hypothetical protein
MYERAKHFIVSEVAHALAGVALGVHTHNDNGCAVANSILAVAAGCSHVQGTMNGYGERAGNADLTSIIPALVLKMGEESLDRDQLKLLTEVSHFVAETANVSPYPHQPYVGTSAFAHKGGVHASAAARLPVSIVSASSRPGSRRCTCRSTKPGLTTRPAASITRSSATGAIASPTSEIEPSVILMSPVRSPVGSMIRAPVTSRLIPILLASLRP